MANYVLDVPQIYNNNTIEGDGSIIMRTEN